MSEAHSAPRLDVPSLADRYSRRDGNILISGVQALVRLMLLQSERDRAAGLNTNGFISGYRGSPLGTLDSAFAAAGALSRQAGLVVKPAVNEELAATAVAGTQQIENSPGARVQGIFSLWYGKGPGLDRASDAIRHGNFQGSSRFGGVVVAVGDDHLAKSSSIVCYSDETVASLQLPLLYPADPEEITRYGLHGFEASRLTGSWMALKIITEVADSTRAVPANELEQSFAHPAITTPAIGLHNRWPEMPLEQEARQQDYRLPAVHAYVRANNLDRVILKRTDARVGFVASGKSWMDLLEALRLLGLDEPRLAQLGIALYKPALIWPLEPQGITEFAQGLQSLYVVEEKAAFVEAQIKTVLYGIPAAPAVWGKAGPDGICVFPRTGELNPELIAVRLGRMLHALTGDEGVHARLRAISARIDGRTELATPPAIRKPFFCSGCPHNRSTVLPEGSRSTAGIGCHGLAAYNRPRTTSFSQMGGEGIHWMGIAPFTDEAHMFANLGDGTYFHSGLLAIRQAVAAKLNITYKLLYNSAVAMTGGQAVDGELSVDRVISQLRAEGVGTIIVSTDDPDQYPAGDPVRKKATRIEHRDDLDALQRELRDKPGVSVIVYEQMCASEKRRLRKRGRMEDPPTRVFINELVCEGCGDCSAKSNCLSVEPVQTAFGVKRRINQSSCNKDYSCTTGFCPSFVSVEGGSVRKPQAETDPLAGVVLPPPPIAMNPHQRVLVAGVGGTGVVTIGALLSMAGHIRGRQVAVLDQVGMAQKGGAVTSHIHLANVAINALRIPPGEADIVIVCDEIVGNAHDVIAAIDQGRTRVLANADVAITGDFTQNPSAVADSSLLARRLEQAAGEDGFLAFPFTRLADQLLGDAIGANLMMVGAAYQKGWLSLDEAAFTAAVELNGIDLKMNLAAFVWGRRLAVDPRVVFAAAGLKDPQPEAIDQVISHRADFLAAYQDGAYARRYLDRLAKVRSAVDGVAGAEALVDAAARSLFKLMAYKDEYEVARLFADPTFKRSLESAFEGDYRLTFHLAPPLWARRDPATGHLRKSRLGAWMLPAFKILAKAKGLRGGPLDIFGYTQERRMERGLIGEFEALLERLCTQVSTVNLGDLTAIVALPLLIRGYGHVKEAAVGAYRADLAKHLAKLSHDAPSDGTPFQEDGAQARASRKSLPGGRRARNA
jgi:indolepyruvate ferredoxin oxidoreductase